VADQPSSTCAVSLPRFHGLDSLRAVAMLLGVVLHAILYGGGTTGMFGGSAGADIRLAHWIHSFRMPLFFMISGFFSHQMFVKHGVGTYLTRRWWRLGVPMLLYLGAVAGVEQLIGHGADVGPPHRFGPGLLLPSRIVAEADRDGNRLISRDELLALAEASFDRLDPGRAGRVNRAQFAERLGVGDPATLRFALGGGARPGGGAAGRLDALLGPLLAPGLFAAADENRDGWLTREEWRTSVARWYGAWDPEPSGGLTEEAIREGLNAVAAAGRGASGGGGMPLGAPSPIADRLFGRLAPQFMLGPMWFLWYLVVFATVGPAVAGIVDRLRPGRWPWRAGVAPALLVLLSLPGRMQSADLAGWTLGTQAALGTFPDALLGYQTDWPFYFTYFLAGWWLFRVRSELSAVARGWLAMLATGVLTYGAGVVVAETYAAHAAGPTDGVLRLAGHALFAASTAFTSFGLVGVFQRFGDRPVPVTRYLADVAFWVYLVNQPLLVRAVLPGLRPHDLPWWLQTFVALVMVTSIAALTFELFVRRTPLTALFGPSRPRQAFPESVSGAPAYTPI
jgi:Acyltransferase family